MPHLVFGADDDAVSDSETGQYETVNPVASTSKLPATPPKSNKSQARGRAVNDDEGRKLKEEANTEPEQITFKKRHKRRADSESHGKIAIVNGHDGQPSTSAASAPPPKKVRTFYREDEDAEEEDVAGTGSIPVSNLNGATRVHSLNGAAESKKQARKRLQKERKERADFLLASRMKLPVWYARDRILEEIDKLDTVVVLGETGSGKTTQIPQFLLHSKICRPEPRLCVTQPRRVAATSLAARVAEEVGCHLGGLVGYAVRFDDTSSPKTRLKYVTDGTLLQEILSDQLLECYDVVVIDEAHERTLRTDMILGFLKEIQKKRKEMAKSGEKGPKLQQPMGPLKIVVMSATLDARRFSDYYDGAKVLYIKGREYKVTVKYLDKAVEDYIETALKTIFQIHCESPPGDILVFLSGQEEIQNLTAQIESYLPSLDPRKMKMRICPLYARLTPTEQNKAFNIAPPNTRKVVLATNVAETSITISGIKYVVDTGLAKEKVFHPVSGLDSLLLSPISKSSATQRAGRAGRESNGYCFRLYPEASYRELRPIVAPEIQRCSLSFALLHLLASGYEDVFKFPYMDRPDDKAIAAALMELVGLGAVDGKGKINQVGRRMVQLPLEPRQSRTLLASFDHGCTSEIIDLLALLGSADQLLSVPFNLRDDAAAAREKFIHRSGDHMMLLNILKAYEEACKTLNTPKDRKAWCRDHFLSQRVLEQVLEARKQIRQKISHMKLDSSAAAVNGNSDSDSSRAILTCMLEGHFANTAMRLPDNTYRRTAGAMRIKLHPSSVLHGKNVDAVVFSELVFTKAVYARIVSSIPLIWLRIKVRPFFGQDGRAVQQA